MSLVIDGSDPAAPRVALNDAITHHASTLFVVAAGNKGDDLNLNGKRWLPAVNGANNFANVLTVASVDADGQLSKFSNRGDAAVDIAAPGCRIASWLDADSEEVPLSGTSQAAPIVSFAAALLKSVSGQRRPRWLKSRIDYSGDLLATAQARKGVASMSQLNIQKALLWPKDYVRFVRNGAEQVVLGVADEFTGMSCVGVKDESSYRLLRALKKDGDRFVMFTSPSANEALSLCPAQLKATIGDGAINQIHVRAEFQLVGDDILPSKGPTRTSSSTRQSSWNSFAVTRSVLHQL
uniref:S8 family serine peptidase n=1 Tax=Phenylobacterium glaciei TaxID=2803784 RepID=A0A974P1R1_9CAUL|nr:S8 family serine peptidase [Phenylobacterium glaciei]